MCEKFRLVCQDQIVFHAVLNDIVEVGCQDQILAWFVVHAVFDDLDKSAGDRMDTYAHNEVRGVHNETAGVKNNKDLRTAGVYHHKDFPIRTSGVHHIDFRTGGVHNEIRGADTQIWRDICTSV